MNWQGWIIIGIMAAGGLYSIGTVGKPRAPRTPEEAVGTVIEVIVICLLVIFG